jgi:hypothetical protein
MVPAEKFDIDDLDAESTGYAITDPSVAVRAMDHFFDETPFANACAIVCKKAQLHVLNAKRNRPLRERYDITEITLYFSTKNGAPMPYDCFLIQFGHDRHVQFQDRTDTVKAKGILAESVRLSVQLSNFDKATDFSANVKSSFAKAAMTAVGPTNLYKEEKPFYTTTVSATWRKGNVERHLGFTCVKSDAYENVLRRSGLSNIIVMEVGRSKYDICRLKNSVEIEEARTKAKLLGPMAYGIICTTTGFAIRVKPEDKVRAEKLLDPEYAELLGDTMMTLPPGDGLLVEIRGVPRQMDDMTLVRQLSASAHGWKCKPLRLIKTDTPGRKTVLAVTDAMPAETFTKIKMASEIVMVSVHRHATKNIALWDKVGRKTDNADDFDVTPQKPKTWGPPESSGLGARPKAAPQAGGKRPWQTIAEDTERVSHMAVDASDNEEEEQQGSDGATSSAAPAAAEAPHTPTPMAHFVQAKPQAPQQQSNKDALFEKLKAISLESDKIRSENVKRHQEAEERFGEFQRDVETKMTLIGDTLAVLQDGMKQSNASMDARMNRQETTMVNMASKLDQMFAAMQNQWAANANAAQQASADAAAAATAAAASARMVEEAFHEAEGEDEERDRTPRRGRHSDARQPNAQH